MTYKMQKNYQAPVQQELDLAWAAPLCESAVFSKYSNIQVDFGEDD